MDDGYVFAEVPAAAGAPLLVLLHGTGGDENDLIDLGRDVMPGAHLIAARGDVSEAGAPRFFRRLGPGLYDMSDLSRATAKLGSFIRAQRERLGSSSVAALGYSNGANLLASLLFTDPAVVDRAVLMHPMIPFDPPPQPGLAGRRVLITAGRFDPIVRPALTQRLATYFKAQGMDASMVWHEGGHEVRPTEIEAAGEFLA